MKKSIALIIIFIVSCSSNNKLVEVSDSKDLIGYWKNEKLNKVFLFKDTGLFVGYEGVRPVYSQRFYIEDSSLYTINHIGGTNYNKRIYFSKNKKSLYLFDDTNNAFTKVNMVADYNIPENISEIANLWVDEDSKFLFLTNNTLAIFEKEKPTLILNYNLTNGVFLASGQYTNINTILLLSKNKNILYIGNTNNYYTNIESKNKDFEVVSNTSELIGSWESKEGEMTYKYTFNKDLTLVMSILGKPLKTPIKYGIENGVFFTLINNIRKEYELPILANNKNILHLFGDMKEPLTKIN